MADAMTREDMINALEFGSYYTCFENDTPKIIAEKMGYEVRWLVQMNKDRLPGLFTKSKLRAGTEMALPYDGLAEEDELSQLMKFDESFRKPTKETLLSLYRALKKLDKDKIFMYPVLDEDAPLYSKMILRPMCWTQMRKKIDADEYSTFQEMADDFALICRNAIVYNEAESEYHQTARKLLAKGVDLLDHFQWTETLVSKHAQEETVPDEPYAHYARKRGANKVSLDIYPNSNFLQAVPRVGVNCNIPIQIPEAEVHELKRTPEVPVTPLDPSPWHSFAPRYDGSCATTDLGPFEVPVIDLETTHSKHYTDYATVAKCTVRPHAAAMARIATRMSIPREEHLKMIAQTASKRAAKAAREDAGETEPVSDDDDADSTPEDAILDGPPSTTADTREAATNGTATTGATGTATPHPNGTAAAATTTTTAAAAAANASAGDNDATDGDKEKDDNAPPEETDRAKIRLMNKLESNIELLAKMQELQTERLASETPTVATEEECALAAQFRMQTEAVLKTLRPQDVVSEEAVREALGVKIIDPRRKPKARKRTRDVLGENDEVEDGIRHMSRLWRSAQKMQRVHFQHELKGENVCDNCNGSGVRFTLEVPEAVGSTLCHACGLYQASYGRPRPARFATPPSP